MNNKDIIYGINAVYEALEVNKVKKLYLSDTFMNKKIFSLIDTLAIDKVILPKKKFDEKFKFNSQGIVAEIQSFKTYSLDEIYSDIKNVKNPLIVILDEIMDPHNLGAILRSCDVFGVNAVIYKNKNQVSLNGTVAKVSTGAINYVKCCSVTNLSKTIENLKKNKFWIVGLAGEAKSNLKTIPEDVPLAIVIGNEGKGISRLVRENCDFMVKIPMQGHVNCLNASVSCAITLYQIRNR